MRSTLSRLTLALVLLTAVAPALAVGTEFTWQGELRENGQPASGSFDFEFRLFAAASGGSPIGPLRSLSGQSINGGVYSALLDFGDQFTGEPRWLEISVRRSGQPTFVPLLPRQPLTATPYAQHADFVADNSIVGANIVDGSIVGADIALGGVSTTQIANAGVQTVDLADGSVTGPKLGDGAVSSAKIAAGGVTTTALADASVTAAKLAPGAVGAAQIDTTQVQARLRASCPDGLPLLGIDADGDARCADGVEYLAGDLAFATLALGFGDAPMVFGVAPAADTLKYTRCGDATCSDGEYRVDLDANVGNSGAVAAVLGSVRNPLVAYHDVPTQSARLVACVQTACTTRNQYELEAGGAGIGIDLAMRTSGRPFAVYLVDTGSSIHLKAFDCTSADCSSGVVRSLDTTEVSDDSRVTIAFGSTGNPIVFYEGNGGSQGLNAFVCSDTDCTTGTVRDVNDDQVYGLDSVVRSGRGPIVAYTAGIGGAVKAYDCIEVNCASGSTRTLAATSSTVKVSVVLSAGGRPAIAYHGGSALRLFTCDNASCASGTEVSVASGFEIAGSPSMVLRADGRPVILYEEEDLAGALRLRIDTCGNQGCSP